MPASVSYSCLRLLVASNWPHKGLSPSVNHPCPTHDVRFGHPALRSLHAGYASPSWLRLPPSPATGHGQPLAATSIGTRAGLGLDDVRTQTAQSDGGRAVIKPSPPRMISPVSLDRPRIVARSSPITHES